MNLKETLNLPDPSFTIPMKADLAAREPGIQAIWEEKGIYRLIQEDRKEAETYVLHDGPPYTNGPIHIGTALNKVLKDFVVKSQTLAGKRVPYVPGFDNHGLPIEMAVQKKLSEQKVQYDLPALRKACREHAEHYIGVQIGQFKRLGVFGTWDKSYTSMDYRYEAEIIRIFRRLVEKGFIYRGLRPVLWSPTSQTALADTEIIYKDHVSKAITVAFPLKHDPRAVLTGLHNPEAVIWTTTPWTIPANVALAFHPAFTYVAARIGDRTFIVLQERLEKTLNDAGFFDWEVVRHFSGADLEGLIFSHPIYGRDSVAVLADYVTTDDGTGIVHTAPGHGREDFLTGKKYNLPVLCPVNHRGILTEEAGQFAGLSYMDCDTAVVDALRDKHALLAVEDYRHTYPHAERDEKPVIFRATEQWFISVDHDGLRQKMLSEIDLVDWLPASGQKRITAMIANRPDWCISRQRPWGVGIPVFYGAESGEPVLDPAAIESVARLVEKDGSDAWYTVEAKDILPPGYVHPVTGETEFRKETDVFDVWFDSACTNLCVLEGHVYEEWGEEWPADMFLEGSDQHRGWFNVSLIVGTALKGQAPYRSVVTHGFVVDQNGIKVSKRLGNNIDPVEVCSKYGADILRYWAASVDYSEDAPCTDALLKAAGDEYRKVRNSLRYLLGNLADYSPDAAPGQLRLLDQWIVVKVHELGHAVMQHYRACQFNRALGAIHRFCVNEVSAVYADAIKDRMYCDGKDWESRRSAQAACHEVLLTLTKLLAPVLVHTAEEVYERIPGIAKKESVHLEVYDDRFTKLSPHELGLVERFEVLLETREAVFAELEKWRNESGVKDSQDAEADLSLDEARKLVLESFHEDLPILFKMAAVHLRPGEFSCRFAASQWPKCSRSWLRRADVEEVEFGGEKVLLSHRDRRALGLA